ncbi:deoxyribose-phosphate aldolase [Halosquirtibacter xylanolyticus]|uniref:deoxyribose-phosphate aldolase n=1 Tax=Halosquirtibacter xylanolyticus TaxID=3374599 RepID=UPI0037482488|nr:deoxyribose-phosphate aldolase [Prolixibacteraceae bacterium]
MGETNFSQWKEFDRKFSIVDVRSEIKNILETKRSECDTLDFYKLALSCIDLTTLNSTDTQEKGLLFTQKVNEFSSAFPELSNVAAICVYPKLVRTVRETLNVDNINLAAVSGCFPSSMTFIEVKCKETEMTVEAGANEIDIVIPIGDMISGDYASVFEEVKAQKKSCGNAHLKVILESGILEDPNLIWKASLLSMYAGADFIKTSTGKMDPAATIEASYVMSQAIAYYYQETGVKVGFKPAGGIAETHEAIDFITVVRDILGDEWMNSSLFRFGASRLANNLLSSIKGEEIKFF